MKIALFHELPMGGARVAANNLAKFLKESHQVDLYTILDNELDNEKNYYSNVFTYNFFSHSNKNNWIGRFKNDTTDLIKLNSLHKKIAEDINKHKYDIAFVHASKFTQAPFILKFIKIKKIYYCQEVLRTAYEKGFSMPKNISSYKYVYEKVNRFLRKQIDYANLENVDLILTNSKFTQRLILKNYHFKSKVMYLGIDSSYFKPLKIDKNIDIFFIGDKNELNGYNLLEEALKKSKLKNVKVKTLSGKWITDDELLKTYNRSRIVVNLEYHQPFGLIPLEAMACCVAPIVLNDSAYKETIVEGENGFLINNTNELSEKIKLLLKNPNYAKEIGKRGRNSVTEKWDWKIRIKDLNAIFNDFI